MVKMCGQLTASLAQHALICQQEIMAVSSIEERLLRLKPMLMRPMTMKEVFSAASSLYHLMNLFLSHH